jgi:MFS family permease
MQTMFVYMIAFAQQRFPALGADGIGKVLSTSFLALNAVAALLPALALLPLARKFGEVRVHSLSLATMAVAFAGIYLFARTPLVLYTLMALLGVGWAAIVSLPFSIMSQRVDPARIGLYMGVFNLSIVLPQLVVSLGVGRFISVATDKGLIFVIGAVSMALSAIAWRSVSSREGGRAIAVAATAAH